MNGTAVSFSSGDPSRLSFVIGPGVSSGPIAVYTSQGQSTTETSLTVLSVPPVISAFDPISGPPGTVVAISGAGLSSATAVSLNGAALVFSAASDSEILAQIPSGANTGAFTIATPGGTATSNDWFHVNGNAAVVFWASQPVSPNETVLVSGANITPDATIDVARLPDSDPGDPTLGPVADPSSWSSVTPLQIGPSSVKFVLPAEETPGVFAYRIRTVRGSNTSATYLVNRPDVWFVQGDQGRTASPGGWLRVFGNSLSIPGSGPPPQIAIVSNGSVVRVIQADPAYSQNAATASYAESYPIPADLAPGDYQLYVHNGYGGPAAWTRFASFGPVAAPDLTNVVPQPFATITIAPPLAWPTAIYKVAAPHPDGSPDDDSLSAAIAWAADNQGGVLQLTAGSYTLSSGLTLPDHTVLAGAGKSLTTLNFTGGEPLISGSKLEGWGLGAFSVRDLTVSAPGKSSGTGILMAYMPVAETASHVFLRNTAITLADSDASPGSATGVVLRQIQNVEITGVDIDAPTGIMDNNSVFHLRIENCNLWWRYATIFLASESQDMIVANNHYTLRGNAAINGYGSNPNPGFWFAAYATPFVRDLYYANNVSASEQQFSPSEPSYYGMTSDGNSVVYFGGVAAASGTDLHLTGPTSSILNGSASARTPSAFWSGGVVMVLSGTGTGQSRIVTSNVPGSPEVQIDQPWDVLPDATSIVTICAFEGRALFINNDFGMDPTNQDYYISHDVIHANNRMESFNSALRASYIVFRNGQVGSGVIPGWHVQALGNQVLSDNGAFLSAALESAPSYSGAVTSQQIIRDNTFVNGIKGFIRGQASSANLSDIVIENNITPIISILTTGNGQVDNLLIRNNQLNSPAGGQPQLQLPANIKGILVLPQP